MSEPQKVSFEQGLARLEEIAEELGEAELSVEDTIALLRDGKGAGAGSARLPRGRGEGPAGDRAGRHYADALKAE